MFRILFLCLLPFALFGQNAGLTVAGIVADSQTGEPIPRALVSIQGFAAPDSASYQGQPINRTSMTDISGAFRFSALPPANYFVLAQKPGFGASSLEGREAPMLELKSSIDGLRVRLAELGVIMGKVVDDNDEPMRGVSIVVLSPHAPDGLREVTQVRRVNTDARGLYRIADLRPGKYHLKATGQSGANFIGSTTSFDVGDSFAPRYSGGEATMDSAKPIEIGAATHATADFHLKLEPAWQIRGTLRNFIPRQKIDFSLVIAGEEVNAGPDRFNPDTGVFEFKDVVSGSYLLRTTQNGNSGEVAVNVTGEDAADVVLPLYPPVDIPVTIRFTNPPPAAPKRASLAASDDDDDDGPGCQVMIDSEMLPGGLSRRLMENGYLGKVGPGNRRVSTSCFGGYVRSAFAGAQNLLADPVLKIQPGSAPPSIEILATYGGGTIKGKVDGSLLKGLKSTSPIRILLVPQASGSGEGEPQVFNFLPNSEVNTFSFPNLAPGTYSVYALSGPDAEFRNPAFLRSLSGGQNIQLEGEVQKELTIDKVIP